jgi:hypothetical protein
VRLGGHNAVEAAGRLPGRTHKEPEGGMASLKRVQNFISDVFSFINQKPG